MTEVFAGKITDFQQNGRRIVKHGELEIGVLQRDGAFYAFSNVCLHQGGPACEGLIIARVEDVIAPDGTYAGQRFSKEDIQFVCPWHGYAYDLRTGVCAGDPKLRLRKFETTTKGDAVYVVV